MKIIKQVGERLLPHWLRAELKPVLEFTGAGTALLTGSAILAERAWKWLMERLNIWEGLVALAAGVYLAGYGCLHVPHIARFAVPGAIVAWCVAAWWVAPAAAAFEAEAEAEAEDLSETSPEEVYAATLEWIRGQIGNNNGVHLSRLLAHAQAHGMHTDLDLAAFRAALEQRGFPVRQQLKVGRRNRPGIHRDDLPTQPLSTPSPEEDTGATTAVEYHA